jgi:hypothetical protein
MTFLSNFVVTIILFAGSYFCLADTNVLSYTSIPYGPLEMSLRSRSNVGNYNGTTDRFILDVLSATLYFLDNKMKEFFANDERVQYQRVAATNRGYEVRQEQLSTQDTVIQYEADISITGFAIFATGFEASRDIVVTIVEEAFINDMDGFLKRIWDISRDPFLRETSTSVVVVNSTVPYDIANDPTIQLPAVVVEDNQKMAGWLIALLVGSAVFCIVFASWFAYVCTTKVDPKSTASGETENENGTDTETDSGETENENGTDNDSR